MSVQEDNQFQFHSKSQNESLYSQLNSYHSIGKGQVSKIVQEMKNTWGILYHNSFTIFLGTMFSFSCFLNMAVSNEYLTIKHGLEVIYKAIILITLYLVIFDLMNQIAGYEEDKISKPTRPIPSGLITLRGAFIRLLFWTQVFLLYCLFVSNFIPALVWTGLCYAYNFMGLDRHWFNKNVVFITAGTLCMMSLAKGIVDKTVPYQIEQDYASHCIWAFTIALSASFGFISQDERDIEGDKVTGRQTLPIVYPVHYQAITAAFFLLSGLTPFYILYVTKQSYQMFITAILVVYLTTMCYLAFHSMLFKTRIEAKFRYKTFLYTLCWLLPLTWIGVQ